MSPPRSPADAAEHALPRDDQHPSAADLDRLLHDWQSRFTGGKSPSTVGLAMLDWAAHAANAPFQTAAVLRTAAAQWQRLGQAAMGTSAITPAPGDHRFADPAWQAAPFGLMAQAVLLGEEWWASLVQSPAGVDPHNARIVAFTVRQWLDMMSPSNVPWLNPQVIAATRASGGVNLANGMRTCCGTRRRRAVRRRRACWSARTSRRRPARSCSATR